MKSPTAQITVPDPLVPSLLQMRAQQVELLVRNDGAISSAPGSLKLTIPELSVEPVEVTVPALAAGVSVTLGPLALPLARLDRMRLAALQNQNEGLRCSLEVVCEGNTLARKTLSFLPPNAWRYAEHPEALGAFADKDADAVQKIKRAGRPHLQHHLGVSSFIKARESPLKNLKLGSEYQRVSHIVAAVYECLLESFPIHYEAEPRTFPPDWQKVRWHDQVLHQRQGTCIELALLQAACLEEAFLDPVIIVVRIDANTQHALLACWQAESQAPSIVMAEYAQTNRWLKKSRSSTSELLLWDPTGCTVERNWPFSQACEEGRKCFRAAGAANFVWAVDLRRARDRGISPLPFAEGPCLSEEGWQVVERAQALAREHRFDIVERTHVLLALLDCSGALCADLLGKATCDRMRQSARARLQRTSPAKDKVRALVWARGGRRVLERAKQLADEHGAGLAGPVQLWHGLVEDPGTKVQRVLADAAVNVETFRGRLVELAEADPQRDSYIDSKSGSAAKGDRA
jgi:hypothetical protein